MTGVQTCALPIFGADTKLTRPVTLAEIKADKSFASFPLVRMSRLSVMPVTDAEWNRIEKLSRSDRS